MPNQNNLKCQLIKLEHLSGDAASIYSVKLSNQGETELEKFIAQHLTSFKSETIDIVKRLKIIGNESGASGNFFKEKEGIPGDGVCALYDNPNKQLRLYCIRYGKDLVVVGGGGTKPKSIIKLQEKKDLKDANYLMRKVSNKLTELIKEKEIIFSNNFKEFRGDLEFEI